MIKSIKVPRSVLTFNGKKAVYRPLPDDLVTSEGVVKRKSLKGRQLEKLNDWIAGLSRDKP